MDNIIVWFGLCLIPFVWFLQNVIHESSHGLIPLARGCSVKIYPWPKHMNGRWYMAYCTWQCVNVSFSKRVDLLISAAPRIADLLIIVMLFFVRPENAWVNTALMAWQIAALVDFSFNTVGIFYGPERQNDAWTCAQLAEIKNTTALRAWSVIAVAAAIVPVFFRMF
jgi:hypothetical protein